MIRTENSSMSSICWKTHDIVFQNFDKQFPMNSNLMWWYAWAICMQIEPNCSCLPSLIIMNPYDYGIIPTYNNTGDNTQPLCIPA